MRVLRRFGIEWQAAVWTGWLAFVAWAFSSQFVWHIRQVYLHSPSQLQPFLPEVALLLLFGLGLYLALRRRGFWKYEFAAVLALPIVMVLGRAPLAGLAAALIGCAAFAIGDFALDKLRMLPANAAERLVFSSGVGFGLLIYVLFWLGLAGLYLPWVAWILAVAPCLLFGGRLIALARCVRRLHHEWGANAELRHGLAGIVVAFTLALTFVGTVMAIAPSTAFDPLKMHLAEALYFVQQHALRPMPMLQDSYYPQSFEVLMSWAWMMGGQTAAQLISPLMYGVAQAALYRILRRAGAGVLPSVAGTALAAVVPALHWTGWVPKNDASMAAFQFLALLALLVWLETRDWRWLPAASFFLACSFSVKHVALFGAVGMAPFFLYALWKEQRRIRALALMAVLFAVFGLYWHARTYALKGNPLYPAGARDTQRFQVKNSKTRHASVARFYLAQATGFWSVHFAGWLAFESPSKTPLGACFLLFVPAWLVGWRSGNRRATVLLLLFCVLSYAYWSSILWKVRYGITFLLVGEGLTAARAAGLSLRWRRFGRSLLSLAAAAALVYASLVILLIEMTAPRLLYFAGLATRDAVIESAVPSYDAMQIVNQLAKPDDYVATYQDCPSVMPSTQAAISVW